MHKIYIITAIKHATCSAAAFACNWEENMTAFLVNIIITDLLSLPDTGSRARAEGFKRPSLARHNLINGH